MKVITCQQLGGACNKEFKGNTFEEIAEQSKSMVWKCTSKGIKLILRQCGKMKDLMQSPEAMKQWFEEKRKVFDALPNA
jgi:hypothetical protein